MKVKRYPVDLSLAERNSLAYAAQYLRGCASFMSVLHPATFPADDMQQIADTLDRVCRRAVWEKEEAA
jgi:hypothetical protein